MAKWVKKKFNVGLFIVLLLCAFVPGIIYGIYCAIPTRVSEGKPKSSGWVLTLIGVGINLAVWLYWVIWVIVTEEEIGTFYIALGFAVPLFLLVLVNKDGKRGVFMVLQILVGLAAFILNAILLYYAWIGLIGLIVSLVGLVKMHKYHKYLMYGDKVTTEEQEEVVEETVTE